MKISDLSYWESISEASEIRGGAGSCNNSKFKKINIEKLIGNIEDLLDKELDKIDKDVKKIVKTKPSKTPVKPKSCVCVVKVVHHYKH